MVILNKTKLFFLVYVLTVYLCKLPFCYFLLITLFKSENKAHQSLKIERKEGI